MIRIKSSQAIRGEETQNMEFMTEGKYYFKNGSHYIVYNETELSGMEGCTITLKLSESCIKMKRYGDAQSELLFELSKRHKSDYVTPYGVFKLELLTHELEWKIDEQLKGKVYIKYEIAIEAVVESINILEIDIL